MRRLLCWLRGYHITPKAQACNSWLGECRDCRAVMPTGRMGAWPMPWMRWRAE